MLIPFLKWVGGKRQLLPEIIANLPQDLHQLKYFEPFIGGGAVFFYLQPQNSVINDSNLELINVYQVVKENPDKLIADLKTHQNTAPYFYQIRELDRTAKFEELTNIQRASRIIYLNKTCYNGLYRVNNSGKFNAPFGGYKNPNIINEAVLKAASKFLNKNQIEIRCDDYENILQNVDKNSFVYLDPPYHPISASSNFTGYVGGGWSAADQVRLKNICDQLSRKGTRFLLSNSAAEFIKEIYSNYKITMIKAKRSINSNPSKRGAVYELLIKNYD